MTIRNLAHTAPGALPLPQRLELHDYAPTERPPVYWGYQDGLLVINGQSLPLRKEVAQSLDIMAERPQGTTAEALLERLPAVGEDGRRLTPYWVGTVFTNLNLLAPVVASKRLRPSMTAANIGYVVNHDTSGSWQALTPPSSRAQGVPTPMWADPQYRGELSTGFLTAIDVSRKRYKEPPLPLWIQAALSMSAKDMKAESTVRSLSHPDVLSPEYMLDLPWSFDPCTGLFIDSQRLPIRPDIHSFLTTCTTLEGLSPVGEVVRRALKGTRYELSEPNDTRARCWAQRVGGALMHFAPIMIMKDMPRPGSGGKTSCHMRLNQEGISAMYTEQRLLYPKASFDADALILDPTQRHSMV